MWQSSIQIVSRLEWYNISRRFGSNSIRGEEVVVRGFRGGRTAGGTHHSWAVVGWCRTRGLRAPRHGGCRIIAIQSRHDTRVGVSKLSATSSRLYRCWFSTTSRNVLGSLYLDLGLLQHTHVHQVLGCVLYVCDLIEGAGDCRMVAQSKIRWSSLLSGGVRAFGWICWTRQFNWRGLPKK